MHRDIWCIVSRSLARANETVLAKAEVFSLFFFALKCNPSCEKSLVSP